MTDESWLTSRSNFPAIVMGKVLSLADNERRFGSVQVHFPWMPESKGIWCRLLVSFAGPSGGVHNPPGIGDWVVCLLDSSGLVPPCILGAFFTETNSLPKTLNDPVKERLLFHWTQGENICSVLVKEDGSLMINASVFSIEIDKDKFSVSADKIIELKIGKNSFMSILKDKMTINGNVDIIGELNIKG